MKGTLREISPADVFQLLGRQRRSGVLRVTSLEDSLDMWMEEGLVRRVDARRRPIPARLGQRVLRAGLVDSAGLEKILDAHRRLKRPVGTLMVMRGVLSADLLETLLEVQAQETLYGFFGMVDGNYEFIDNDGTDLRDGLSGLELPIESVLMEGLRRVNEWPQVRDIIHGPDVRFRVLKAPPPPVDGLLPDAAAGADDDLEAAFMGEATGSAPRGLGPDEYKVMEFLGPGVAVQQVVDQALLTDFRVYRALATLVELGFLEPEERGDEVDV
ncbi:MAG: DUF4388 domain-containing protein [Deltaproteobacteria bacterium]|nr:DUF4388 domain-containing protein [Deltaproteobacteria bacterium]